MSDSEQTRGQGEGGRLREGPAPELVEASFSLEVADAPVLHDGLSLADLAHVLTLMESEVIPLGDGRRLLELLLELDSVAVEDFPLDRKLEDVYSNREAWVRARDDQAGGWMGAGRPRREPATIAYRIATRDGLLELADALVALVRAIVGQARAYATVVLPDYTYLQPATPTSLGHYLVGFAYPLLRDLDRVREAFARTNQCPGGIGNINGTSLALDRERLAELLGFDSAVTHTRDAMWQTDQPVEVLSVASMALVHGDRLSEDLQIWNTQEFGLVELADRHARISMIMPQKKNPYSLAFVRGMAGHMIGRLVSMSAVGKTPSAQMDNRIFAVGEVPRALTQTARTVRLLAGVIEGVKFDRERMESRAGEGFIQAMDLAETIMEETGVPYRQAHRVVGLAVRLAHESERDVLDPDLLAEASQEVLGRTAALSDDALRTLRDPAAVVATRTGLGGAAPAPVEEMLSECDHAAADAESWHTDTSRRLERAGEALRALARSRAAT